MKQEDTKIASQFSQDARKAFRALFERYYKGLYLVSFFYLQNEQEAEDIVQQVFTRFWEEKHYLQIKSSYRSFLYTAVKNACLNTLKKNRLTQNPLTNINEEKVKQALDFILDEEQQIVIRKACQEIPQKSRVALELVYLQHYSYQKAAEELGISINTLKSNLKLALSVLRKNKALQNYFFEKSQF